ncbi:hypothetical protein SDRG_04322 [Saprolegnia diclina VS20]|uniref:PX domain-containing protein n=1 Tax=Saprolegnia diclina (strain VS20) TaxID=1156394 RepID=T0QVC5_SAPDV|nr:hypothetical protein SDRG_04322 [Saprolegnia diclina VS20]EQC38621.1 hypothetical protein SDRG_04322 [Saprolegnia diclina VS20]|eukprot:XP_008608213.1 hypothetical protein SDRG_04322 [Saprolegnia diclina VS20]
MGKTPGVMVSVVKYDIRKSGWSRAPYVSFVVQCAVRNCSRRLEYRYSDFYKLKQQLAASNDLGKITAPFPPKAVQVPYVLPTHQHLATRQAMLEAFLRELISVDLSWDGTKALDAFLKLDTDPLWSAGWSLTEYKRLKRQNGSRVTSSDVSRGRQEGPLHTSDEDEEKEDAVIPPFTLENVPHRVPRHAVSTPVDN